MGTQGPPAIGRMGRRRALQLAAAGAAAYTLSACAPTGGRAAAGSTPAAAPAGTTVPFQLYVVSIPVNATSTKLIQDFVDQTFNAQHKGVRAVFQAAGNMAGIAADVLAGKAAPVVVSSCCSDWVTILPLLAQLDPWLKQGNVDPAMWTAGQLSRFQTPTGLFGLPEDAASEAYLYRQDILDSLGLEYPAPTWTSVDAAALWASCTGTVSGRHRYGTQLPWESTASCGGGLVGFPAMVQGWSGGAFMSSDGTRCLLDQPGSIAAGEYFFDLTWSQIAAPGTCGSPTPMIFTGQAVFAQGAEPTILEAVQQLGSKAKWDFVPYPRFPARPVGVLHDNFYGMLASAPDPELAWELLQFAAIDPDWSRFYMQLSLSPPSLPSLLEEWTTILQTVAPVLRGKYLQAWTDPTMNGDGLYDFEFFKYSANNANALVSATWPKIWNQQLDVTAGFQTIAQQVNALETTSAATAANAPASGTAARGGTTAG